MATKFNNISILKDGIFYCYAHNVYDCIMLIRAIEEKYPDNKITYKYNDD